MFNSTTLDCERKFRNFWGSSFAVRRLSDLICIEHGLSVIENPKPSRGSYGDWLGDQKAPTWKSIIKAKIDELLPVCKTFDELLAALRQADYLVKDGGKYVSVQAPGQKKPTRLKTLGENYTEAALRERLVGAEIRPEAGGIQNAPPGPGKEKARAPGRDSGAHTRVNLLIDIQEKIRQGKGAGYEHWAKLFNLKIAARTLLFLRENGIETYADLEKKSSDMSAKLSAVSERISELDGQQKKIAELQKQIGVYSKTRAVYETYRKSGWKRSYYDEHTADIIAHRNSKKFFDSLNLGGKVPPMATLKQEWATLNSEKKLLWGDYHRLKDHAHELAAALGNTKQILGIGRSGQPLENTGKTPRTTRQRNAER